MDEREKAKRAHEKAESIVKLLDRQIKLKEMCEDKLKDALDIGMYGKEVKKGGEEDQAKV